MTSQLRKKRPTTRPNSHQRSEERGARNESRSSILAARSLGFTVLALAVCVSSASAGSELKWRTGGTTQSSVSQKSSQLQSTQNVTSVAPSPTSTSLKTSPNADSTGNALRFVRPSAVRMDTSVRPAAFEEDAPRLTSGRETDISTRSVVVNRDDSTDSFRSAQLAPPEAATGSNASGSAPSSDRLRAPFGDSPTEQPQLQNPQFDSPSSTDTNVPPKDNLPVDQQRQPAYAQPEQPRNAPPVGQFQPVLPSGPTSPDLSNQPTPLTPSQTIEAEGTKAKESCEQSLENLRAYTVDKVKLNIVITGVEGKDYPFECSIDDGSQHQGRCWDPITYMWKASALCHKPLYFEDEQLERYGHSFSPCFQPFISGAHFFCTLPVLPYCMGVEPPCECVYALGHYRPGSCAPYMCNPVPLSVRGAVIQAGAVTGAAAALP